MQIVFSGKIRKKIHIISLSSADFAQREIKVKGGREVGRFLFHLFLNSRVERKTVVTQTYFLNACLGATLTPLYTMQI